MFGAGRTERQPRRSRSQNKLERFVNFKPQTPLREIIRLTANL